MPVTVESESVDERPNPTDELSAFPPMHPGGLEVLSAIRASRLRY